MSAGRTVSPSGPLRLVAPVDLRVVRDPVAALLAACAGADLVVVGTRLSGRRDGDVGSVSGQLVRDAPLPGGRGPD